MIYIAGVTDRSDTILKLIATMKLVKGVALVAVAFGAVTLLGRDVAHGVPGWIDDLQPANHYLRDAIARIEAFDPQTLRLVAIATLVYAALFLIEGFGLFWKRVWAEYMTTILTTSFIPIESYELVEGRSAAKAVLIGLNLAVAGFLVWRLRRDGHWPFRRLALASVIPDAAS